MQQQGCAHVAQQVVLQQPVLLPMQANDNHRVCSIQDWPAVRWQQLQIQAVLDTELQDNIGGFHTMVLSAVEKSQPSRRVLTHSSSSNGSADGHNSLLLANDPGVQSLLHLDQLLTLITADLLDGNTCIQRGNRILNCLWKCRDACRQSVKFTVLLKASGKPRGLMCRLQHGMMQQDSRSSFGNNFA